MMLSKLIKSVKDVALIDKAFAAAAQEKNEEALRLLISVSELGEQLYDVLLLRGALYAHLKKYDLAISELTRAVKVIDALKGLSKDEVTYLKAYASQYAEFSIACLPKDDVPDDVLALFRMDDIAVNLNKVPNYLKRKFPLKVDTRQLTRSRGVMQNH